MNLKLDFPPTPEHAAHHAHSFVEAMLANENIALDYTLESLRDIDGLLKRMHGAGATVERIPSILFRIGCYVGEVFCILRPSSLWVNPSEFLPEEERHLFPFIALRHPDASLWAPINKAFVVLESPQTDSLHYSCSAELARVPATRSSLWSRVRKLL